MSSEFEKNANSHSLRGSEELGFGSESSQPPESTVGASSSPPLALDPTDIKSFLCKPHIPKTIDDVIAVDLVDRPRKDHWFRIHSFDVAKSSNCWPVNVFEYEHAGEMGKTQYFVNPESDVGTTLFQHGKLVPAILILGIYQHGQVFVWCVKTPSGKNKSADKWATSRVNCAQIAQTRWVTMTQNDKVGYFPRYPVHDFPPPEWGTHNPEKLFELACKDRIIMTLDHEVIRLFLGIQS